MIRSNTTALLAALAIAFAGACKKEKKQDKPQPIDHKKPDDTDKPDQTKPDDGKTGADVAAPMTYVDPGAAEPAEVSRAVAVIAPTEGNEVKGTVWFEAADKGLTVKTELEGLPEGEHAYHVHLYGDCSGADGKSAGTHFNFSGPSEKPPADIKIITGDLGNLVAGKDGKATAEATIEGASLQGKFAILGRAVIVHEKPNDPKSPPIGAAGGRLGCGVIGIAGAK